MGLLQRAAVARWAPAAGLALIIVAGATIGFAVSRRPPPAPPPPTPRPEAPTPRSVRLQRDRRPRTPGTRWNGLAGGGFPLGVQPVAAAFDPVSDTLLAVGGEASRSPGGVLAFVPLRWVGGTWTVVQTTEHLDSFAGLAQDPSSRRLIVAAANGFPAVPTTSTAWSWTGGDWKRVDGTAGPPWPQAETADQTRGRLLLFATLLPPSQNTPQYVHVWAWQGTKWRRLDGG